MKKPASLTWIPVETAINDAPGTRVSADQGELQKYLDAEGVTLPFQAHFSQVKVGLPTKGTNLYSQPVKLIHLVQLCHYHCTFRHHQAAFTSHAVSINLAYDYFLC